MVISKENIQTAKLVATQNKDQLSCSNVCSTAALGPFGVGNTSLKAERGCALPAAIADSEV